MVTAAPYAWMAKRRERYGDVFSSHFPFFGRSGLRGRPGGSSSRCSPDDPGVFHAGEANATVLGDALGDNSLLTLDEGRHLSQRKLLLPPFHGASVRRYVDVMAEATAREVERWPVGKAFALRPHMQAITLDVILRAVFGVRDGERMDLLPGAHPAAREPVERARLAAVHAARPGRHHAGGALPQGARGGGRADLRGDRRPPALGRRRRARRRPDAAARRPPRGRLADDRRRAARRADDPADRRARDDGDRAVVGVRAAAAHAAGAGAAARVARRRRVPRRRRQGDAAAYGR